MMGAKILFIDIETKPLESYLWRLFDEQKGLPLLKADWSILSWSAKWYGESKIHYRDQRRAKDLENDKVMLQPLWKMMDEADIIIGHNSKKFDVRRLNARFLKHGMGQPSGYRQIDTLVEAKKHFDLTSNSLEYVASYLRCKFQKLTQRRFPGFELWRACLARNPKAWDEMAKYNQRDVLVLEEVYRKLSPWITTVNFGVFHGGNGPVCSCGSTRFVKRGASTAKTNGGVYQRYWCSACHKGFQSKQNLLTKEKRRSLLK